MKDAFRAIHDQLTPEEQKIINVLESHERTDDEQTYFKKVVAKFDFIQKARKDPGTASGTSGVQKIAHDERSIQEMAQVMKHLSVPRGENVIEYNSQGNLFYMLIHGEAQCKVPF